MKNSIQGVDSITTMPGNDKKTVDPVQEDYDKGKQYLENNEPAQAAIFFHNALLGYEEKGDDNGVANASNQLGHVCLERQEYEKALANYQRSWEICEKENDRMSLLSLQKQFVLVYRGLKQYDKAVNGCLELLDQYSGNNDPANGVAMLELLAEIYMDKGDIANAADSYRMIASIHAGYNHKNIANDFEEKAKELLASN